MPQKVYIDLSNLIAYAAHFDQISGVQRIEIEIAKLVLDRYPEIEISNAFDQKSKALEAILRRFAKDEKRLLEEIRDAFLHWNLNPARNKPKTLAAFLKTAIAKMRRSNRLDLPKLAAGDFVLVPGGFGFAGRVKDFYTQLAARGGKLVFFVQDVFPVTRPELSVEGASHFFAPAFHLPSQIVTTTQFNVQDISRAHEIVTGNPIGTKPLIVPLAHEFPGVPRNAPHGSPSAPLKDALQGEPFVLCVGTVEVRKNHLALLEVWRALRLDYGNALPRLVIAGRRGWKAEAALAILDQAEAAGEPIRFVEAPSDDDLKYLYAACAFSILPSLAEGWGLPIGESLWFGKACAVGNTTSLPDVGGELSLYFDPADPENMKAAIRRLLDPAFRESCETKIRAAALRTWADVARDLVDLMLDLAEKQLGTEER